MKDFIIKESTYHETMKNVVVPELSKRQEEIWFEREPGRKLYCAHYRADDPKGVLLLSHGFTESAEKYQECIYYFLQMGFHTVIVDHCGHGNSYRLVEDLSLVHTESYERYVDDLIFVCDDAKNRYPHLPFVLYGHSMGGGIAAALCAKRNGLFEKVILSSPMIQPKTSPIPWIVAELISFTAVATGKEKSYVVGQKPYQGKMKLESSPSTSQARFDYYEDKRCENTLFQTNAPSYGWFWSAVKLKHFLMSEGWKQIRVPVLVFQAEYETFVSNKVMKRFVQKVNRNGNGRLVHIKESRHEIYNSKDEVVKKYWNIIRDFLIFDIW